MVGSSTAAEPCELLVLIEGLTEANESFKDMKSKKNHAAAQSKIENDALRSAALKGYTLKGQADKDIPHVVDMVDVPEISDDPDTPAPLARKNNTGSSGSSSSGNKSTGNRSSGNKKMQAALEAGV